MHERSTRKRRILIITSTWPRWEGDATPSFVQDFAIRMSVSTQPIHALAPHYKGAKNKELYSEGKVILKRYHYALPYSAQSIAYEGGAVQKIKITPLYVLKLLSLLQSLMYNTLFMSITKRIDVIHAHWLIPQGFVAVIIGKLLKKRAIITIHGGDVFSLNGGLLRKIKRLTLKHADIVIVNSSATKAACIDLYKRDYPLIPMGIDMGYFSPGKKSESLIREHQLGEFTILFVGRLVKDKATIDLLKALKILKDQGREFKALVVGSGPEERALRHYATRNKLENCLHFVGWVQPEGLREYYRTADIMVGPSIKEAQGLVFVEALACGLPVITTDSGGTIDFLKNGKNGMLVPVHSPISIAQELAHLQDNRQALKSMSRTACKMVKTTYSWDATVESYTKIIQDLD
jgi:glycosyltransferase involved in cell wall biosynthesis